jgi:transposase InsO family protein
LTSVDPLDGTPAPCPGRGVWSVQKRKRVEHPILAPTCEPVRMDRDIKYSAPLRAALIREQIEPIRLPPRSPNLNAFAERFCTLSEDGVFRTLPWS